MSGSNFYESDVTYTQGHRKVWKSEGTRSIIFPPGWDRVNCLDKNRGGGAWLIHIAFESSGEIPYASGDRNICRILLRESLSSIALLQPWAYSLWILN